MIYEIFLACAFNLCNPTQWNELDLFSSGEDLLNAHKSKAENREWLPANTSGAHDAS